MLFIPITIVAAGFQVARNAVQRSLVGDAGPWGATLVRFLFGLPFSLLFLAVAALVTPGASLHFTPTFWIAAIIGAAAQVGATGALLTAMHKSGFALGAVFQQSSLPLAAVVGLFIGEPMSTLGAAGVAITSAALLAISWPKRVEGTLNWGGALAGLTSGACYAIALNAYRMSALAVAPHHAILAAVATTSVTQAMQTAGMVAWLGWSRPQALRAVLAAWRQSLSAGFFGATASAMWLAALALAPAAPVRAIGVIEMPLSAIAGRKLFAERLAIKQLVLGAVVAGGVVLAALA